MSRSTFRLFEAQPHEKSDVVVIRRAKEPLSQSDITNWLGDLRDHSYINSSHFSVACVIEAKVRGEFIYAAGVNVENKEQNRLGMHGEQNALVTLQSFLGGNMKFSKAWIMAADEPIKAGSKDKKADAFSLSCGHCRQILISFVNPETTIYAVSCNGAVSQPYDVRTLLPEAFSELDLSIQKPTDDEGIQGDTPLHKYNFYIDSSNPASLKPHIINPKYITSPISAVTLKLVNGCYIPGVLVQDAAFLTTDAVFSAFGHAIARFGAKGVEIVEIHLYGNTANVEDSSLLASSELSLLREFGDKDTPVFYYQADKLDHQTTLASIAWQKYQKDFGQKREEKMDDLQAPRQSNLPQ